MAYAEASDSKSEVVDIKSAVIRLQRKLNRLSFDADKVVKVNATSPPTYLLKDMEGAPIKGCFYEAELLKTRHPDSYLVEKVLRRRHRQQQQHAGGRSKIYVKWLGFSDKHNSWINEDDVV